MNKLITCLDCEGDGTIDVNYTDYHSSDGLRTETHKCERCNGTGKIEEGGLL